ncbi:MAG: TetR/AcrR family transcriptional regulator [Lachnospiraceae bacterium]|nr:TetR/AcrR family transcriptional regulator [Lachnospiraceae bacterium]
MENQRIRVTKRMLKEALVQLLENKPIEKVTVYEICQTAEINRTTFYKYYGSPYDLIEDIEADFLHELEINLQDADNLYTLQNLLTYINTHRDACLVLLKSDTSTGFLEKVFSHTQLTRQLEERIAPDQSEVSRKYLKEFVVYGSYSIVRKWLLSEQPEPPEEIARIIINVVKQF